MSKDEKIDSFVFTSDFLNLTGTVYRSLETPGIAEPPSPPGDYLEPSSHFVSRLSAPLLLKSLVGFLEQKSVKHTLDQRIFRAKCTAFPPGQTKLSFFARVFRVDDDSEGKRYAVEFQRRSGDVIYFSSLWQSAKDFFQSQGCFDEQQEVVEKRAAWKPLPSPETDLEVTDAQAQETVQSLLQMVSSTCYDVRSQAFAALSKMSAEGQVKKLLLDEGCMDTFVDAMSSDMEDIRYFAQMITSNLKAKSK